ncbi:thiamine phosphate synthase [Sulfurihydrogenibium azorense]|uniref:Thiamine-phosphate pyrophosphorylase (TMPpyrophosphorylase) (TMP-PPase) (Thiamine-phosphate synthase) n=1 Tax=Sulfurihydrogenibium azorense (strain DSM 15241 / OCM 825 / Az-Fu1) TaxID=204536 RepID=C1DXM0_SULAA|nr:thiamine phosphate synthase [Sulfurihydrogenibium azorense]ACN98865.1 thiamine-phosphate pyrophosphorylase (TMPpyrophosphorylase) (TMP-PPase) (Thiamine-phosphate synthase) [Sulfurihydrogenibium azorense Az-Fu1]MDM7272987.1 thiamine phosphate synthase [Sulfurihydrogenibium azorense]
MHRFYFITDRKKFKKPFLDTVKEVLEKGVRLIQIREKDLPDDELYKLAESVLEISKGYDAKIFINSRVDIAYMLGLDGVHLTSRSVPVSVVKRKFPDLIVGKSCHSVEDVLNAEDEGADYVFISPIFEVEGKGKPIGIEGLKKVLEVAKIPVYALGGINNSNVEEILKTGVYGVAGIRLFL